MASFRDFQESASPSLDQFKSVQDVPAGSNQASNKNLAAQVAVMQEDPNAIESTYKDTLTSLDLGDTNTALSPLNSIKAQEVGGMQSSIIDLLANPDISDEAKIEASFRYMDVTNEEFNSSNVLSSKMLAAESEDESAGAETVRVDIAGAINEVNKYQRDKQAMLNHAAAQLNSNTSKAFFDFLEHMIPYTEEAKLGDITNEFNKKLNDGESTASTVAKAVVLMGEGKIDIKRALESMAPHERYSVVQSLIEMVNTADGVVLTNDNDFTKLEFMRAFLEDGYYTNFDRFADDFASILDMVGLGSAIFKPLRGAARLLSNDVARSAAKAGAQPASVIKKAHQFNPSLARRQHDFILADNTGEVAQAIAGTGKAEAIADNILPEIKSLSSEVEPKTANVDKFANQRQTPDADVMDFVTKDGSIYLWEEEKRKIRARVFNDFKQAEGVHLRSEASQIGENTGGGVSISAIYGTEEGGFRTAQEAMDKVRFAFRDYGIADNEIKILKRDSTGSYKPTDNLAGEGDFVAQVDYNYKFNPFDATEMSEFDVKWNLFDRLQVGSGSSGTLQRHLVDIHSMLNKEATIGANVAVDKAAGMERALLDLGKKFTDKYVGLPKDRQQLIEHYIKEANHKGIEFNYNKLVADGFTPDEISAIQDWRKYWDTVYWVENRDLGKTLKARGYQIFEDGANDTRLFAKQMIRQQVSGDVKVYDSATNTIRLVPAEEVSNLYKADGFMAKLRSPIHVGDDVAEFIQVDNQAGKTYLRTIRDNDQILNYRNGYYQVVYTAPKYIVKRVKDSKGKVLYEKAVGIAGDTAEATKRAEWHARNEGGVFDNNLKDADFFVREDIKGTRLDSNDYWTAQVSAGRTAQKARGQRLEDASSTVLTGAKDQYLMSPVDSMINSAMSVSRRVPMRDYIESMKRRFLQQYEDILPKNEFKQAIYPNHRADIQKIGDPRNKKVADARTVWEYIDYLEAGYSNAIDDGMKAALKLIGDGFAKAGLSKAERVAIRASQSARPTGFAKNLSFQVYLALNPFRQLIVQSHQAILLAANFLDVAYPSARHLAAMISYNVGADIKKAAKYAKMSESDFKEMVDQFKRSGLSASVDKQNLIRGSLSELATQSAYRGRTNPIAFGLNSARKVGFDFGEYFNIASAWVAHRNRAIKQGKKLDDAQLEEISGLARNYTYNMNAAGDLPYNQNALGIIFQYMQVPHKAVLQITGNRVLSRAEKARLAAFQGVMYTLPPGMMYALMGDILPEDQATQDAIVQGLEGAVLNKLFSLASGEDVSLDYSGLAPLDMYGTYDFITSLWSTDLGKIIASTPSGQLLFGNNPRITNAFKTAARYAGLLDDHEDPTTLSEVAETFSKISSGYSNAFKAAYALEYGKKINTLGGVTDPNVNTIEAIGAFFGLPTIDETKRYWVNNRLYEESKAFEDDIKTWYRDVKHHLANKGIEIGEAQYVAKVFGEGWRVFSHNDIRAREIITQLVSRDVRKGDDTMIKGILKTIGINDRSETRKMLNTMPNLSDEQRQKLLDTVDYVADWEEPK